MPFSRTSWGVGVLNSATLTAFTIGVRLVRFWRAFGISEGGWTPQPPPRYATVVSYTSYMRCTTAQRLFTVFLAQRQSWYAICERQSGTVEDCPANISIFLWQLLSHQCTPYWRVTRGSYNAAIWSWSTKGPSHPIPTTKHVLCILIYSLRIWFLYLPRRSIVITTYIDFDVSYLFNRRHVPIPTVQ